MLKLNKRTGLYTNSTNTNVFNPLSGVGISYGWYQYAKWDGVVLKIAVVNTKNKAYSATTSKHIGQLRELLNYPKVEYVYAPNGLNNLMETK